MSWLKNILKPLFEEELNKLDQCIVNKQLCSDKLGDALEEISNKEWTIEQKVKEIVELKKQINDPDVMDAEYWNNKWQERRVWYDWGNGDDPRDVLTINEQDKQILYPIAEKIINEYMDTPEINKVPLAVLKWRLKSKIEYVTDVDNYNRSEFWAPAVQTWQSKQGDCDDLMILEYCLIRLILQIWDEWENNKHRLKCAAGNINNSRGRYQGGHAYLIWLHDDGEWYTVESTYLPHSTLRKFGDKPQKLDQMYGVIWFTFNEEHSWAQFDVEVSPHDFQKS